LRGVSEPENVVRRSVVVFLSATFPFSILPCL
jgi:hypothetical protein